MVRVFQPNSKRHQSMKALLTISLIVTLFVSAAAAGHDVTADVCVYGGPSGGVVAAV